jgi:ATP:ADP antiporter, AAA family
MYAILAAVPPAASASRLRGSLPRVVDLREGEGRPVLLAAGGLFSLIAAHTMLETARDALFLEKLPPSRLTLVYLLLAVVALAVSALNTSFVRRFGRRKALIVTLMMSAVGTTLLYFRPQTPAVIFCLYVWSGLLGAVLVTQYWSFAGQMFTVAQGKRLFGPIAAGGVFGAVLGAGGAALLLRAHPVGTLLLVASAVLMLTATLVTAADVDDARAPTKRPTADRAHPGRVLAVFRTFPYLRRVGALVALSTAATLVVDYLFKSTAARAIPPAELGAFFARYYAALNAVALAVQLLVTERLLRRLGVTAALTVLPLLLMGGGVAAVLLGGAVSLVLLTKGADGALRHSLHRVASELLFMPVPAEARDRAKPLLDTVLGRGVQALTAGGVLALATLGYASPRVLAAIVAVLAGAWVVVALGLARPYVDLFRQALAKEPVDAAGDTEELDLDSVEAVMKALSSRDAARVIAAIDLLEDKGRVLLIPGLILYHESEEVLVRALRVVGAAEREDWIPLAERLLTHAAEPVRVAAVRALAQRGLRTALEKGMADPSAAVRAYAAFSIVRADAGAHPATDPRIRSLLALDGTPGQEARGALLAAIRDAADARFADLLVAIARDMGPDLVEASAMAMARVPDPRFVPLLIARLRARDGRAAVREAIAVHGEPALDALERALRDPATDPRVRLHIPRTISHFGSQRAADFLTAELAVEWAGGVRYKILRGLGRLAADSPVRIARAPIEAEMRRNLIEHLRILALWVPFAAGQKDPAFQGLGSGRVVLGLLEDKLRQSLERAFRLLQIAHENEDILGVYAALRGGDKRVRANVLEFLDALPQSSPESRALLHLCVDDLSPADRVARASEIVLVRPRHYEEVVVALLEGKDESLAALAAHHALELGILSLRARVVRAFEERPSLRRMGAHETHAIRGEGVHVS